MLPAHFLDRTLQLDLDARFTSKQRRIPQIDAAGVQFHIQFFFTAHEEDGNRVDAASLFQMINFEVAEAIRSHGCNRPYDFVAMDTFDFYDNANGAKISGTITNIYINASPNVIPNAERCSGAGRYVIIESDTTWNGASVGVIQRATVRANEAIAAASPKLFGGRPLHDHRNRHQPGM